jgi:hypothetical protein
MRGWTAVEYPMLTFLLMLLGGVPHSLLVHDKATVVVFGPNYVTLLGAAPSTEPPIELIRRWPTGLSVSVASPHIRVFEDSFALGGYLPLPRVTRSNDGWSQSTFSGAASEGRKGHPYVRGRTWWTSNTFTAGDPAPPPAK